MTCVFLRIDFVLIASALLSCNYYSSRKLASKINNNYTNITLNNYCTFISLVRKRHKQKFGNHNAGGVSDYEVLVK